MITSIIQNSSNKTKIFFLPLGYIALFLIYNKIATLGPLLQIALVYFLIKLALSLKNFNRKSLTQALIKEPLHLSLYSFFSLSFVLLLFNALKNSPVEKVLLVFLIYPTFIPLILRAWMGKKFSKIPYSFAILMWLATLLLLKDGSIISSLYLSNAIMASINFAILWCYNKRISINLDSNDSECIKSIGCVLITFVLALYSFQNFNLKNLVEMSLYIPLLICIELLLGKITLSMKETNLSLYIYLAPIVVFFSKTLISLKALDINFLVSFSLFYFGAYLFFMQKNVLPKGIY